jgi:VWFA-related protein
MFHTTWLYLGMAMLAIGQEPIRVSTRLIETNVVVRDSHGPVDGLTVDAFKLLDDGKEQKISVFRVSKSAGGEVAKTPLPPGIFSNRGAAGARQMHYRVLLIDTLNTQYEDQQYVKKTMLKMAGDMKVHDPIAIYTLGEKFQVLQDFTTDADKLKKAMESFEPVNGIKMFMSNTPNVIGGSMARARNLSVLDRTEETLDVFNQLARYLERVPGRKSIVWVSNAFPAAYFRGREDPLQALKAADVAIYPVHARGLAYSALSNPRAVSGGPRSGPGSTSLSGELDTITWVAGQTGGKAFYNQSDLDEAVRQALDDGEVTYTLGFYAQLDKPDDKFHTLKVHVDRPGVEVRSRAEYLDGKATAPDVDPATLVKRVAEAPEDAGDIGLVAAVARTGANFQIAVQVDFKDLRLDTENGRWKGSAEVTFLSQSADGKVLAMTSKSLNFDMSEEAYRARLQEGFALEQMIPVREGTARIRVVMIDRSGAAGVVSIAPLPK